MPAALATSWRMPSTRRTPDAHHDRAAAQSQEVTMADPAPPAAPPAVQPAPPAAAPAIPRAPAPPPAPLTPAARRRPLRSALLYGIPLAVVVLAVVAFLHGGRYVSTDDAYVKANIVNVGTDVAGLVSEVAVHENELVEAGRLLYRLDDAPYRAALAEADARLMATRNDLAALRATYQQKLAETKQAETDADYFAKELARIAPLAKTNAATPAQIDAASRSLSSAQDRVLGLRQEADARLADLGGRADAPVEEHARVRAAQAAVAVAALNLSHARVSAPAAGIVSQTAGLRPGLYLAAGQPALALVESARLWAEASAKETDLTFVHPGQRAVVTVDTYPGHAWLGTVETISPATGAQFALIPAQNATGNWVKVVQRIPVHIALQPSDEALVLRAGMSVTVTIDTLHERTLGDLVRGIGAWFGLGG
jgi:membrane fusion protein (multidrug efflux system)